MTVPLAGRLTPLAIRHLREQWGRSLLTALGVAMGVALFVGTATATVSVTRGLDEWMADARGLTDVTASPAGRSTGGPLAGGAGVLPATDARRIGELPGVEATTGFFGFPTTVATEGGKRTSLQANQGASAAVLGLEFARASQLYTIDVSTGELPGPAQPAVVLTPSLASTLGVGVGDRVEVAGRASNAWVDVSGVLHERGLGRLGDVAFTSLETAWTISGGDPGLSQIAIRLDDGVDADDWVATHQSAVGEGVHLTQGSRSIARSLESLAVVGSVLTVLSIGVVFLAGFLVHLTLSMSVVERVQLYGLLAALGATASQIRRLVIAEAVGLGVVASVAGTGLGVAMAWGLLRASGRLLGPIDLTLSPIALLLGAFAGVGITVLSALVPAARAATIDAVVAIRGDYAHEPSRVAPTAVGAVLVGIGGLGLTVSGDSRVLAVCLPALLLGTILVLPSALKPLAPVIGRLTSRLSPGAGDVAVLHLAKERNRSAYTLALVMVAMALAAAAGTTRTSFIGSFDDFLDREYGRDFDVVAPASFTREFVDQIAAVDGVATASPANFALARLVTEDGDEDVQVYIVEPDSYLRLADLGWTPAAQQRAIEGLRAPDGILFPSAAAERLGLAPGDTVTIVGNRGPAEFRIVATAFLPNAVTDVYMNREAGEMHFGVDGPDRIAVTVASGYDAEEVATRIETAFGDDVSFIVATVDDFKADLREQVDAGVSGFALLLVMAGVVGLFGLANTLAVSMIRRFREIGILRAIGARRRQVAAMALVESLTLVAVAFLLAIPLGAFIARPLIATLSGGLGDLGVEYRYPWMLVPALAVVGLLLGGIASLWPARRAAGLEIDAALRFD